MVGVRIQIGGPVALLVAIGGAILLYTDAKMRRMDTADMWAVGFFIGVFVPPIIGAIAVVAYYFQKRPPRRGYPPAEHRQ